MGTWVLILILSIGPNLQPISITNVPGYLSVEACRLAGEAAFMADAKERIPQGKTAPMARIEFRCIPGS